MSALHSHQTRITRVERDRCRTVIDLAAGGDIRHGQRFSGVQIETICRVGLVTIPEKHAEFKTHAVASGIGRKGVGSVCPVIGSGTNVPQALHGRRTTPICTGVFK